MLSAIALATSTRDLIQATSVSQLRLELFVFVPRPRLAEKALDENEQLRQRLHLNGNSQFLSSIGCVPSCVKHLRGRTSPGRHRYDPLDNRFSTDHLNSADIEPIDSGWGKCSAMRLMMNKINHTAAYSNLDGRVRRKDATILILVAHFFVR